MTWSDSVRRRIVRKVQNGLTIREAVGEEGHNAPDESTVRRWLASGLESSPRTRPNREGAVSEDDFVVLMDWLHQNPRRTYGKMAEYLFRETLHAYTKKQVRGALKKHKISRKKINVIALQRDEHYRREWRLRMKPRSMGKS
jgi:transposase